MKIRLLVAGVILLMTSFGKKLYAQDVGPISTDRPTQSISSYVIPHNSFQFEQGFTFTDTVVLDGFFRLGVSDLGEIRLLTNYNSPGVTLSAKIKLIKPKDYRPGIGISASVADFRITDYRLMIDQKISDNIGGVVNVGYGNKFYTIIYGGFTLGDKFSTFLEAYFESQYTQLNTGLVFLLNRETQLDLNLGLYNFDSGYVGLGFARRFMFKE